MKFKSTDELLEIFEMSDNFFEAKKNIGHKKIYISKSFYLNDGSTPISHDLFDLHNQLVKKLIISEEITNQLSYFSNSIGGLDPNKIDGWLVYVFMKIKNFVNHFTVMMDKKIFNLQIFCSMLRDFYLYVLQVSKILSESDISQWSSEILDKYFNNKHSFIFDIRNSSKDFENIFKKLSIGFDSIKYLNINKNILSSINKTLQMDFVDFLCNYVHHNRYSYDHPLFFETDLLNDKWCCQQMKFCLDTFTCIFNLFLYSLFLFRDISFANMFEYISEIEFTGNYPQTDLREESDKNFVILIKEFNEI